MHELFHVPSGVMVFAVSLFAVGAFWVVGKIEQAVLARAAAARRPLPVRSRERSPGGRLGAASPAGSES